MAEVQIRKAGRAGRITLNRPQALNALSHEMCLKIEAALDEWRDDDAVQMVVIDAEGEKAFCAGGDIAHMYRTGKAGEYDPARQFWRDEYRMNAKLFDFPKPVAAFMQGFTMGGGVGVGCHTSHRVVGDSTRMAMPECGIGLIPDVGGTLLLARAPGRLGEYLGMTGHRMNGAEAIYAGFADYYLPEAEWPALIAELEESGDWSAIDRAAQDAPAAPLAENQDQIDALFTGEALQDVLNALRADGGPFAAEALKAISRGSPLSLGCTLEMVHRIRAQDSIRAALELEYRFTHRALEHGDFIEGVRAAIIDKDKSPRWQHDLDALPAVAVSRMLTPLGDEALKLEETQ